MATNMISHAYHSLVNGLNTGPKGKEFHTGIVSKTVNEMIIAPIEYTSDESGSAITSNQFNNMATNMISHAYHSLINGLNTGPKDKEFHTGIVSNAVGRQSLPPPGVDLFNVCDEVIRVKADLSLVS
ncbi:unnamed protein product [Oppiella nova]|uniref:Uncharacterized protein n=1 Tax=Oppiella nova TaxID=334625 RepID=A0A7R9LM34_9ACAR|nr:unnamed protein product [Oppiella nova]CAG2164356.1 unnamed protein product [Oppiella nova]